MRVHIRLAEPFWRTIRKRRLTVELERGAKVRDLLAALRTDFPALSVEMDSSIPLVILGDEEAAADLVLQEGDQVHLVWPVAGG